MQFGKRFKQAGLNEPILDQPEFFELGEFELEPIQLALCEIDGYYFAIELE